MFIIAPEHPKGGNTREKGATTVEYAVIVVLMILVLLATVLFLADPTDRNSLLPNTYQQMGSRIGNFGSQNIVTN